MADREGQCPKSVSIYFPKAFRIALWTRYRLWDDVRGVILGGLYQAWWNTVGGIVSTAAKGRGSNCGVSVCETNALGETTSWACDLHESSCLSASATSSGWTGALVGDMRFQTARQAGPLSHLTHENAGTQRDLSDVLSIGHLVSGGAGIQTSGLQPGVWVLYDHSVLPLPREGTQYLFNQWIDG